MDFEQNLAFEESLFGDNPVFERIEIANLEFWVDRLSALPQYRPLFLDNIVNLCQQYCDSDNFRNRLLEKAIYTCPVLIFRLYLKEIYALSEIMVFLMSKLAYVPSFYFKKGIGDFKSFIKEKLYPEEYDKSFFENDDEIDFRIQYGYIPHSIEYCLKYDDLQSLRVFFSEILSLKEYSISGSPFEWAKIPRKLGYLGFSGYFGSLNCFKYLLMNGFEIDDSVKDIVVCSGHTDLYHMCNCSITNIYEKVSFASMFCRISLLNFLIDSVSDVSICDKQFSDSPLQIGAKEGHLRVVELLITKGFNIEKTNYLLINVLMVELPSYVHV